MSIKKFAIVAMSLCSLLPFSVKAEEVDINYIANIDNIINFNSQDCCDVNECINKMFPLRAPFGGDTNNQCEIDCYVNYGIEYSKLYTEACKALRQSCGANCEGNKVNCECFERFATNRAQIPSQDLWKRYKQIDDNYYMQWINCVLTF